MQDGTSLTGRPHGRGIVYALADLDRGLVKIGYTGGSLEVRRRAIEKASGASLQVLGCVRGSRDDESAMHDLLAEYRVRGEWFVADEAVIAWASELETFDAEFVA